MAKTKKKKKAAPAIKRIVKKAAKTAKKKKSLPATKKKAVKKTIAKKAVAKKATGKKSAAKKTVKKVAKAATKKSAPKKTVKKIAKVVAAVTAIAAAAVARPKLAAKTSEPKKQTHVNEDVANKKRSQHFAEEMEAHHPSREDGGQAFVDERTGSSSDPMATEMARDFLTAAESGVETLEELSDEEESEEEGGPFIVTSGNTEFAGGTDASNPADAEREPFPKS